MKTRFIVCMPQASWRFRGSENTQPLVESAQMPAEPWGRRPFLPGSPGALVRGVSHPASQSTGDAHPGRRPDTRNRCVRTDQVRRYRQSGPRPRAFSVRPYRCSSTNGGFGSTSRGATAYQRRDDVFQGVDVPAGSLLHLRWAAANVDPDEWECPFELNIARKAVTRHLAFSQGPRVCPGAGISRHEQQIAWNRLLDRLDGLEYGAFNTFEHQPGIMLGTLSLNLRFIAS